MSPSAERCAEGSIVQLLNRFPESVLALMLGKNVASPGCESRCLAPVSQLENGSLCSAASGCLVTDSRQPALECSSQGAVGQLLQACDDLDLLGSSVMRALCPAGKGPGNSVVLQPLQADKHPVAVDCSPLGVVTPGGESPGNSLIHQLLQVAAYFQPRFPPVMRSFLPS